MSKIDMADVYMDVELWSNFPGAISTIAAIATSLITGSWKTVLLAALVGYSLAHLIHGISYSSTLKTLFPQFLGGWLIALPASVVALWYLYRVEMPAAGFTQLGIAVANWIGLTDIVQLPLIPVRVLLARIWGLKVTGSELAFIKILNQRASQLKVQLDWGEYQPTVPRPEGTTT